MLPRRPDEGPPPTADEVENIAAQFLAQLQAGERPNREALLRAHPHLADRIDRRLALIEMMHRVGLAAQQSHTKSAETVEAPTSVSDPNGNLPPTVAPGEAAAPALRWPCNPPDYEILCELGHGGMGVVYKARQKSLNRVVALKMIRAGAYASPELMARFHIEAEALASLQHPNIVQIYEVGTDQGCPYMAMEFLEGGALDHQLARRPQPARAAAQLVETLARAMHAAHLRGIIHRDLKPANILLAPNPKSEIQNPNSHRPERSEAMGKQVANFGFRISDFAPKITDFGLAKRLAEAKGQTCPGDIMGTPGYMAPEQAEGRVHEIGPATDIFALGGILYEMLTGQPPFEGESPVDTLKRVLSEEPAALSRPGLKVPRDLETICGKCLEKAPTKRYATAEALADDLRRFLDGEPIAARPASPWERAWKWAKRRPAVAALILVIVAAAAGLAGSFVWSYGQVRGERDRARASLQVARHAVDDLYLKMASERLFDEPQLDALCQELLEKAQTLYGELAQEHSANADVRRDIARAWFRLAEIHRMRDQHDEAERAYGEALARQEALFRDYPKEPAYRQDLANSHNWFGELFRDGGRSMDKAEEHFRSALEIQQRLTNDFPDEPSYRMELARSHYNLGIVQKDTNRLAAARSDYNRAVELLTQLHKEDNKNPNYRQDLARALINRGVLQRLDGRPLEAGRDYEASIALLEALRHEFRARAAYKFELAIAWLNRGNLFWSQGQQPNAQRENQKALTFLQELVADFSSRPRYQKKKGTVLKNLGTVLVTSGDAAGADQQWNEARTIFETLVENAPENADYHGLLGMTLANLAWLRTEQKQWPDAQQWIERSITELQTALARNSEHPDYRQELRNQYRNLAWTLLQRGDHAAAARAATAMAGVFPDQGQYTYFAACFLARCVPLAQKDVRLPEAKRQELARTYVDQAIGLLRQTVATAPPKLDRIKDEKEVFAHPEFEALLTQLPLGG